ncbi:autophagy protein 13 [Dinochytrium kinnereticum]|nr:autophagy protein 13 [Dinochytrium kinnereticum]
MEGLSLTGSPVPLPNTRATTRTSSSKSNKWFNLDLPEVEPLKSEMKHWRVIALPYFPPPPLIIDIFLDLSDMTPDSVLILKDEATMRRHRIQGGLIYGMNNDRSFSSDGVRKKRILLETWQLSLSFVRLLPSYRQFRRLRKAQNSPLKIGYRLSTARFMPLDEAGLHQVHLNSDPRRCVSEFNFGALNMVNGTFNLHVSYRLQCEFTVDGPDMILNTHFADMDENFFAVKSNRSSSEKLPLERRSSDQDILRYKIGGENDCYNVFRYSPEAMGPSLLFSGSPFLAAAERISPPPLVSMIDDDQGDGSVVGDDYLMLMRFHADTVNAELEWIKVAEAKRRSLHRRSLRGGHRRATLDSYSSGNLVESSEASSSDLSLVKRSSSML